MKPTPEQIEAVREQNQMAVHAARFLNAIAYELNGATHVWRPFFNAAEVIREGLSSLHDMTLCDEPWDGRTSGSPNWNWEDPEWAALILGIGNTFLYRAKWEIQ